MVDRIEPIAEYAQEWPGWVTSLFDRQNLRGNGTGVGCADFGDGRRLAGMQALPQGAGWFICRTEINVDGTTATINRSGICDLTLASPEHARFKPTAADIGSFDGGYGSA